MREPVDWRFGVFAVLTVLTVVGLASEELSPGQVLTGYGVDSFCSLLVLMVLSKLKDMRKDVLAWIPVLSGCFVILLVLALCGWYAMTSPGVPSDVASARQVSPLGVLLVAYVVGTYIWMFWRERRIARELSLSLTMRLVIIPILPWFVTLLIVSKSPYIAALVHEILRPTMYLLFRQKLPVEQPAK